MYNDLILAQDDTVCFQIIEAFFTKQLPNGCALRAWERFNKKFQPMARASKTRLRKKFTKCELGDVKRDPEDWIADPQFL